MTWLRALSLLALLAVAGPAAAQAVSLSVLAANPVRYDHRTVTVTGTVGLVEGAGGSWSFTLIDGGVSIRVLATGGLRARTGDRVEVEGLFKLVGTQLEAFRVTPR
ncbi:MAG: hypothetical protein A2146_07445 [Actinobacteria bacterium RBG_16_67_10]|nr:MAG: hypothetical protein A2146_07445 [Actinobacteria bacterium RBG_16_67_10]OGK86342.1 MAG: hypothetical protein A2X52_08230 [Candidatus Rokubacteria bacterium GWC2_70_16]